MRRRISLFVLASLMVLPAVAPVRAAKPVPTEHRDMVGLWDRRERQCLGARTP